MSIADNFKRRDFKAIRSQRSSAMKKMMAVGSFKKVLNKKSKRDEFYSVLKESASGRSGKKQMNKALKETFRKLLDNKQDKITDKQVKILAKDVYGNLSEGRRFVRPQIKKTEAPVESRTAAVINRPTKSIQTFQASPSAKGFGGASLMNGGRNVAPRMVGHFPRAFETEEEKNEKAKAVPKVFKLNDHAIGQRLRVLSVREEKKEESVIKNPASPNKVPPALLKIRRAL